MTITSWTGAAESRSVSSIGSPNHRRMPNDSPSLRAARGRARGRVAAGRDRGHSGSWRPGELAAAGQSHPWRPIRPSRNGGGAPRRRLPALRHLAVVACMDRPLSGTRSGSAGRGAQCPYRAAGHLGGAATRTRPYPRAGRSPPADDAVGRVQAGTADERSPVDPPGVCACPWGRLLVTFVNGEKTCEIRLTTGPHGDPSQRNSASRMACASPPGT